MKNWKLILPLMMSGSLIACTSTQMTTEPVEPEAPKVVEEPVTVETEAKPDVEPVLEVQPKPEVEPEKPVVKKKTPNGMLILGSEEWVYVPALDDTFKARIDTGATTSSMNAIDIVPFERDGKDWVQFKIDLGDNKSSKEFKVPVERWASVKQSSTQAITKRAVVVAYIQIGDYREKTEFTLAERGHMAFPMLLGRSFFRDIAVVDVSKKYIQGKTSGK